MIHGAHVIIYSKDSEADRAFFRDVLKYESVDAGHGWLIFALPPAEVAVHPSEENDVHELFLMCDDVQALIAEMKKKKVECSPVDEQRWGSITRLTLPGGGKLGIYQPKHASPLKARRRSGARGKRHFSRSSQLIVGRSAYRNWACDARSITPYRWHCERAGKSAPCPRGILRTVQETACSKHVSPRRMPCYSSPWLDSWCPRVSPRSPNWVSPTSCRLVRCPVENLPKQCTLTSASCAGSCACWYQRGSSPNRRRAPTR